MQKKKAGGEAGLILSIASQKVCVINIWSAEAVI
jgi:hypothetical protein